MTLFSKKRKHYDIVESDEDESEEEADTARQVARLARDCCVFKQCVASHSAAQPDGDPIKLPDNLESLPRAEHFSSQRHRWNTNEEIAAILISFDKHNDWQSKEVKIRPKSGSMLLYSRKKVRYRRDGYCWKKRKDGKTTREDHMKLKVQGTECIYGCYVHSAILPTFHRRCYWLLQNPDIVLVHYLNVPYPDDNKLAAVAPNLALWADKKEWTKDELVSQLKPMFFSEDEPDINNELEISTAETVEAIVSQLMEKQRAARAAALARQLECGCPDSTCQDSRTCNHPLRRISAAKAPPSDQQVSSTTGPTPRPPRQYTREQRPTQPSPLLLSLGQIQGGGGLLILNGTSNGSSNQQHSSLVQPLSVASFVCSDEPRDRYRQQYKHALVLKREIPEQHHGTVTCRIESDNSDDRKFIDATFERRVKSEPRTQINTVSAPATPIKYVDTQERSSSVISAGAGEDTLVLFESSGSLGHGLFDETLELSHEDIQKTLSANMPTCEMERNDRVVNTSGVESMDFMENVQTGTASPHVVDEDVFVNLDAFDMLGDFPELEVLDPSAVTMTNVISRGKTSEENNSQKHSEGTLSITDYSPEWAYSEGGVKVLVAGPWSHGTETYTVLFDSFPVPTILVQNGLLRCYCPAHEAGVAALQVAKDGRVISDTVAFEYKPAPSQQSTARQQQVATAPANLNHHQPELLRFMLLQRLDKIHGRLKIKKEPGDLDDSLEDIQLYKSNKLEDRLVTFCRGMSIRSRGHWLHSSETNDRDLAFGCILHLAARLGYAKLVAALLQWKQDDPSPFLQNELDIELRDTENFTPLMRASALGESETALVLARWGAGTNAAEGAGTARVHGHTRLATALQRLATRSQGEVFRRPGSVTRSENTRGKNYQAEGNLVKRPSIDSGINMADAFRSNSLEKSDTNLARWERSSSLPLDGNSDTSDESFGDYKLVRRMDLALCETAAGASRSESPLIDVEAVSDDETASSPPPAGEQDDRVFTLAEQIIAAMPDRIKNESGPILDGCDMNVGEEEDGTADAECGGDALMAPLLEDAFNHEFNFEFSDHNYRYVGGTGTPCSSGSPSPRSLAPAASPPPPPAHPALLQEFLNATTHFSNLTLNDREQRELYSAAIIIQKAYRSYRGRVLQKRAAAAAVTIQNCYRRYKQYAYLKQMNAAATVIQQGYREYRAQRKNSNHQNPLINKRTYSQRRQNQAARKIQQFMRQSKVKLQKERAEKEKVSQQPAAVVQQNYQQHHITTPSIHNDTNRLSEQLIQPLKVHASYDKHPPQSPMWVDDDELFLDFLYKD